MTELLPFQFSLRDLPTRERLQEYAACFANVDIHAIESCLALLKVASDIRELYANFFALYNLTEARFSLLMLLYRQKEHSLIASEISIKMAISKPTVKGLLDRLEKVDMIVRHPVPEDRRSYFVSLTQKSIRILEKYLPRHYEFTTKVMGGLKREHQVQLFELMTELQSSLQTFKLKETKGKIKCSKISTKNTVMH